MVHAATGWGADPAPFTEEELCALALGTEAGGRPASVPRASAQSSSSVKGAGSAPQPVAAWTMTHPPSDRPAVEPASVGPTLPGGGARRAVGAVHSRWTPASSSTMATPTPTTAAT